MIWVMLQHFVEIGQRPFVVFAARTGDAASQQAVAGSGRGLGEGVARLRALVAPGDLEPAGVAVRCGVPGAVGRRIPLDRDAGEGGAAGTGRRPDPDADRPAAPAALVHAGGSGLVGYAAIKYVAIVVIVIAILVFLGMYLIPALGTILVLVLFAASRTVTRDYQRLQQWTQQLNVPPSAVNH